MATQIDEDAFTLLDALASEPRDSYISGADLAQKTALDPGRINDAMSLLVDAGLAEWLQVMGTAPFDFGEAATTARGRYEHQRATDAAKAVPATSTGQSETLAAVATSAIRPPSPVGSPYGFKDEDWEIVADRKERQSQPRVVLACQFASDHYDVDELKQNVKASFEAAVTEYHDRGMGPVISLKFKVLGAGYREHLFNEIARDIISAVSTRSGLLRVRCAYPRSIQTISKSSDQLSNFARWSRRRTAGRWRSTARSMSAMIGKRNSPPHPRERPVPRVHVWFRTFRGFRGENKPLRALRALR